MSVVTPKHEYRFSTASSSRKSSYSTAGFNHKRLNTNIDLDDQLALGQKLSLIQRMLETSNKNALNRTRHTLDSHVENEAKRNFITNWVDHKGLDLLQNAIVYNQPKFIEYFLKECHVFPASHQPKCNPYAHVAAYIGNTDCLSAVLAYRPDDYFPCSSEPTHMLRLPPDIVRLYKLGEPASHGSKSIDRFLTGVRRDTVTAESKMVKQSTDTHSPMVEDELKDFKESFSKKSRSKKRKFYNASLSDISKLGMPNAVTKYLLGRRNMIVDRLQKKSSCKITVYRDVFNSNALDRNLSEPITKEDRPPKKLNLILPSIPEATPKKPRAVAPQQQTPTEKHSSGAGPQDVSKGDLANRKVQKHKEFKAVIEQRRSTVIKDDPKKMFGKTPLTLAAEKKHFGSVNYLLNTFHGKRGSTLGTSSISLATSARSPEAIAALIEHNTSVPLPEYQSAILHSLREMYPDTLNVLLTLGGKNRGNLFEGMNLFHMLYSQSLHSSHRHEMLPEMTRVLINCKEDVNARMPPKTYPIYTLIRSAFNVWKAGKSLSYLSCLKMLLLAKANPNFDERKMYEPQMDTRTDLQMSRPLYRSAIHCVLINAQMSINNFENIYWPQIIMQKLLETIESSDRMGRRINNDVLFYYMSCCCELGLNRRVLKILLRYGANPDFTSDGKYPLNTFFECLLPFFTRFEVDPNSCIYGDMLESLLLLCRAMSQPCLHRAVIIFLDNHFLSTPLQALDITRRFCYHANLMITNPRTLSHIVAQSIWINLRRNAITVRCLPITEDLKHQIMPSN